ILAIICIRDEPTNCQSNAAVGSHFCRNLICRPSDTPGLNLKHGLNIINSLLEYIQTLVLTSLLGNIKRIVHNATGQMLLTFFENTINKLSDKHVVKFRIRYYYSSASCFLSHTLLWLLC